MKDLTIIGATNWRSKGIPFGIKDSDRLRHLYIIGKSGVGKSTLLLNMAISDIERGNGFCLLDPHADIAESILDYIPEERINDVIYFDAANEFSSISFNPIANVPLSKHSLVASNLVGAFRKVWSASWGPRLEHTLRFCILSLLKFPKATLLDIQPLLTNPYFRASVLKYVSDPVILNFWNNEFDKYSNGFRNEIIAPVLNKIGAFSASEPLRRIIAQPQSSFDVLDVMNTGKILVCNLAKGILGEDNCNLLGSLLLACFQSATLSRATVSVNERRNFYIYIDEVQSFLSVSFLDMLSEARKYGVGLVLAHQYIEQLDEALRKAIFGNVGTIISFQIGVADAKYLEKEFSNVFKLDDFISLPNFTIYLKLMIDGTTSTPFSATTFPVEAIRYSNKGIIMARSINLNSKRIEMRYLSPLESKHDSQKSLFDN